MAIETALQLVIGRDKVYRLTIYTDQTRTVCVQLGGFTLTWMVKRHISDADGAALITKPNIPVSGTFDPDPAFNTQVATVTIEDSDTDALTPGIAYWELDRVDPGFEVQLAFGVLNLQFGVLRTP